MLTFLDRFPIATPGLRRVAFWLIIALAAYVLVGFLLVPPALRSIIVSQSQSALKRTVHLGSVSFNPLTLRLALHDFRADALEGEVPLMSFGELSLRPGVASVWRMAPVVSSLALRDLTVDIVFFGDGRYSISDLLDSDGEQADQPPGQFLPFALSEFEMSNATIVFDDRSKAKRHVVSEINLSIPFTSSFEGLRKEFTQPEFSAVVNGDPVKLKGRTLPFDDTLLTEFSLGAVNVDLDQYWPYLSDLIPLTLVKGQLSSEISINFERSDDQRLKLFLSGGGALNGLELTSPQDGGVLSVNRIAFQMERFSLGDSLLHLRQVTVDQPRVKLIRRPGGEFNWAGYFTSTQDGAGPDEAGQAGAEQSASPSLRVDLGSVEVTSGSVEWIDQDVPGGFERTYPVTARATGLSTGSRTPGTFSASLGSANGGGVIEISGQCRLDPALVTATLTASDLTLAEYSPYFATALPLTLASGSAGISATLAVEQTTNKSMAVSVKDGSLTLSDLRLHKPAAGEPSVLAGQLAVSGVAVDMTAQAVSVADMLLTDPILRLEMTEPGVIDLIAMLTPDPATRPVNVTNEEDAAAETDTGNAEKPDDPEWTATVGTVRVNGGMVSLADRTATPTATLGVHDVTLAAQGVSTRRDHPLTCAVNATWDGGGTIEVQTTATLEPLVGTAQIALRGLGLAPVNTYLARFADLELAQGAASADLTLTFDGNDTLHFVLEGDSALANARLMDTLAGDELAGIDALRLSKIRLENEPYRLRVDTVRLDDPRAVLRFEQDGRTNIQRTLRVPPPEPTDRAAGNRSPGPGAATDAANATPPLADTPLVQDEPPFFESLEIGRVTTENGQIRFHDASVTPPYSTEMADIRLTLTNISQAPDAQPGLDMQASIGPTPLSVTGTLNPLAVPIGSDLAVTLTGLDLASLSPYTLQYLAYPVEQGRLYAQVTIRTKDSVLSADNSFFVKQLVLGPRDTRPGAPNVPVSFGLALLQDSNGDLTMDLPIRGRLDDPDFQIRGIVLKTVASLFVKALASPFSLIGAIFGGQGTDMDFVIFEPGLAVLRPAALLKLEKIATALKERSRLKLQVTGVTDPVADRNSLRQASFETRLKEQKFKDLPPSKRAWTTVEAMTIEPDEFDELLYQAYKDEPDEGNERPTTFFVPDRQPPEVMRQFIEKNITVTDQDLRELATGRAEAVKTFIVEREPSLAQRITLPDRSGPGAARTGVPLHRADLGLR
ncbi:MAG: DUF748 domain-containing protein [Proteobacteria bacterium]|nr:DUF748 domain-containing protein [Pseudomonadota bacterium]